MKRLIIVSCFRLALQLTTFGEEPKVVILPEDKNQVLDRSLSGAIEFEGRCREAIAKILLPLKISWVLEDVTVPQDKRTGFDVAFDSPVKIKIEKTAKVGEALSSLSRQNRGFSFFVARGILHVVADELKGNNPMDEIAIGFKQNGSIVELIEVVGRYRGLFPGGSPLNHPKLKVVKEINLDGPVTIREILDAIFRNSEMMYNVLCMPAPGLPSLKGFPPDATVNSYERKFNMQVQPRLDE